MTYPGGEIDERTLVCEDCGEEIQRMRYKPDRWTPEEKEDDWQRLVEHRLKQHFPICVTKLEMQFEL